MTILTVEIKNKRAIKVLKGMEEAKLIKLRKNSKPSKEKQRLLNGIKRGLEEVKLYEGGKIKLQ